MTIEICHLSENYFTLNCNPDHKCMIFLLTCKENLYITMCLCCSRRQLTLNIHLLPFSCYTPPHKKWQGILLHLPNFECPSTVQHPSVCPSALRFRALTSVPFDPFKFCIDIGIGEEWYGIASRLILFWNNRVMAFDVCQKCFALCFCALTLVTFYRLFTNFE